METIMKCLFLIIILSFTACANASSKHGWPSIMPLHKSIYFSNASEAGVDIPITGSGGRVLYELRCHNGFYEKDPEFDYSGVIDCRLKSLYSYKTDPVYSLLTENSQATTDWDSNRGRFLVEHLLGSCGDYPDWGKNRIFKLRGMQISIKISNLNVKIDRAHAKANAESFKLTVDVDNNALNTTKIAAHSSVKEPKWFYAPSSCLDQAINKK